MDETLIFYVRKARRKALSCAMAEAECLLNDLQARLLSGGPLSDKGGLFWISVPKLSLERVHTRLLRLGYTYAVDWLEQLEGRSAFNRKISSQIVLWRGCSYRLNRLYQEDATLLRDRAPDRRLFALEAKDGGTRLIRGYRGDDGTLSRRGLAVCDARLLVNLVHAENGSTFLDPFAGVGGIILEALESGYRALSCDIDPILRPGLEQLGSTHYVADARHLPLEPETVKIIATEPPFDEQANEVVISSLTEMYRVLKKDGTLAMLCASHQAERLRRQAAALGFTQWLNSFLNRKGVDCFVLAWHK